MHTRMHAQQDACALALAYGYMYTYAPAPADDGLRMHAFMPACMYAGAPRAIMRYERPHACVPRPAHPETHEHSRTYAYAHATMRAQ